jgi:hypothetical protein
MKKALEAGIEFCNKNINYKPNPADYRDNLDNTVWEDYLRCYISIKHVLKAMLKALDDEPEKPDLDKIKNSPQTILCRQPEPQGSVEELAKFMHSVYEDKSKGVGWSTQESCRVDWDDLPEKNKIVMRYVAYNVMQWLKTKPAIDLEIKRVYDKWKDIATSLGDRMAREEEFFNCIKAHVERGE